jgi:REP element-mobilizing transposase RayT
MPPAPELNRDRQEAPISYLITWACYGAWLPGQNGAIPRTQNGFGTWLPEPDLIKEHQSRSRMTQPAYLLDETRRPVIMQSLQAVCRHRGYELRAAHVRTNHVHVVCEAMGRPEAVMNAMKSYGSRALNERALDDPNRRRWARHGSTRWLWTRDDLWAAVQYVVRGQGEPMEVYEQPAGC